MMARPAPAAAAAGTGRRHAPRHCERRAASRAHWSSLLPLHPVAATDRPRRVLLALQVAVDPVARDLEAAAVLEPLYVAADHVVADGQRTAVVVEENVRVDEARLHLRLATLLDLHAPADPRAAAHGHRASVLTLHVADDSHPVGVEGGRALDLDGSLDLRAVQLARPPAGPGGCPRSPSRSCPGTCAPRPMPRPGRPPRLLRRRREPSSFLFASCLLARAGRGDRPVA